MHFMTLTRLPKRERVSLKMKQKYHVSTRIKETINKKEMEAFEAMNLKHGKEDSLVMDGVNPLTIFTKITFHLPDSSQLLVKQKRKRRKIKRT